MTKTPNVIVEFATRQRRAVGAPVWIKGVSYKDGDGYRVSKMALTRSRDEAARFTADIALAIAVQFSQYVATLTTVDGAALPAATASLRAAVDQRRANARAAADEFAAGLRQALLADAALLASITGRA